MEAVDLVRLERRARLSYEWARLRGGLVHASPVVVLAAIAAASAPQRAFALGFGFAAFALGAVLSWYGRDLSRALLPGMAAGAVPLAGALLAGRVGHVCLGDRCLQLCIPVCIVGGLVAGLLVASVAHARKAGPMFWPAASAMALLTGLAGCACVGWSGALGLLLGFACSAGPAWARRSASA